MSWDPDAVAPPRGDVYYREARSSLSDTAKAWLLVLVALVITLVAVRML